MSNCNEESGRGKESQDTFLPIRQQDIYTALSDAYYGQGGFSPQIDDRGRMFANRPAWQSVRGRRVSYLIPEKNENRYITRVGLTVYYNYFAPIINSKVDPIFTRKTPSVQVTGGAQHFLDWCRDVTGSRVTKSAFLQSAMRSAVRDGVCFVVMDSNDTGKPYLYTQEAGSVDLSETIVSRFGAIEQIAFTGTNRSNHELLERVIWTDSQVVMQEQTRDSVGDSWRTISTVDNPVGFIPVYPLFGDSRMDTWDYLPFPANSYGLMMACYSLYESWSSFEWIKHLQGHSKVVFANAEIESLASGADNAIKIMDPVGSSASASMLSPDPAHLVNHMEAIKFKVEELRRLASENGVDMVQNEGGRQAESGIAKAFTYSARNDVLLRSRQTVMNADRWIVETYKAYYGAGTWTATTKYADDFTPTAQPPQMEEIEAIEYFKSQNLVLAYREGLAKLASRIFVDSRDKLPEILLEIDTVNIVQSREMMYIEDEEEKADDK
jgi:hypothetical protein